MRLVLAEKQIRVCNFQVEDYHTYYVGEDGVLVHNACTREAPHLEDKNVIQVFEKKIIVNKKKDLVRVIVDSLDSNRVITIFPVRGGVGHV